MSLPITERPSYSSAVSTAAPTEEEDEFVEVEMPTEDPPEVPRDMAEQIAAKQGVAAGIQIFITPPEEEPGAPPAPLPIDPILHDSGEIHTPSHNSQAPPPEEAALRKKTRRSNVIRFCSKCCPK